MKILLRNLTREIRRDLVTLTQSRLHRLLSREQERIVGYTVDLLLTRTKLQLALFYSICGKSARRVLSTKNRNNRYIL